MSMTKTQAKKLGTLIASVRHQRQLSLRELAAVAGIDHSWIGYLEKGQFAEPAPERLAKIAQVLVIPLERVDYLAKGAVQAGLPEPEVYFRARYGITADQAAKLDRAAEEMRRQG